MYLYEFKKPQKTESPRRMLKFICDNCNNEYDRYPKTYNKMKLNVLYDMDYCQSCWIGKLNKLLNKRIAISNGVKKSFIDNKYLKENSSKRMRENNPMKNPNIAKKSGQTKKEIWNKNPELSKNKSLQIKNNWVNNVYEGVNLGKSKWYDYTHSNSDVYKVQGTWELAFIEWLDNNNLTFTCHKGRIPYVLNSITKNYYPDFYINEWNCYVDVKADYFYDKEKFDAILLSNPDIKLKLLF